MEQECLTNPGYSLNFVCKLFKLLEKLFPVNKEKYYPTIKKKKTICLNFVVFFSQEKVFLLIFHKGP